MKKYLLLLALVPLLSIGQFKVPDRIQNTDVHDYTGLLTSEQKTSLNAQIQTMRKSSIEMAIVILPDLQGAEVMDAAVDIGRTWGVGKKDLNNGVVYLIVPSARKAAISVGYGLEKDLTDALTSNIQDEAKPFYRQSQYYEGIDHILKRITAVLSPEYKAQQAAYKAKLDKDADALADTMLNIFGVIGILGVFTGIFFWIRYLRIKKVKARALKLQQDKEVKDFLADIKALPEYIKDRIAYAESYMSKLSKYTKINDTVTQSAAKFLADFSNITTLSYNALASVQGKFLRNKRSFDIEINNYRDLYNRYSEAEAGFNATVKRLPGLYNKAKDNLKNTPYTDLRDNDFKRATNSPSIIDYIIMYQLARSLQESYNSIIDYQAIEARKKQDAIREAALKIEREKRRKQQEEDDEEDRRRRNSSSYSSYNSYSSPSSYDSGSSSPSFDYGGGSFGGGGSSSSW